MAAPFRLLPPFTAPLLAALLLLLPCALAHCPTACMEVAYLSGNYFKPFKTALTNYTNLQGAAKCAEACAAKGTKYFNFDPSSKYTVYSVQCAVCSVQYRNGLAVQGTCSSCDKAIHRLEEATRCQREGTKYFHFDPSSEYTIQRRSTQRPLGSTVLFTL